MEPFAYFFTPERQLPADVGFSLFGPTHLISLAVCLAAAGLGTAVFHRLSSSRSRLRVLRAMSATMVCLEILKDFLLAVSGSFDVGYLPLHLCSFSMFFCLYFAWHPNSDGGGQLLWSLCLPGALCALVFPDWTAFPVLHFNYLHGYLYHTLLVTFSLMVLSAGWICPRVAKLWKVWVFLLSAAVPVYLFDLWTHTNYMFLLQPSAGSPLEYVALFPGRWGYLLGFGILVAVILLVWNLPFSLYSRLRGHHAEKTSKS